MKIKSLFTSGKMNKDVDERLVENGEYRDALNVRVNNSNGSDVGAIENTLSNSQLTNLSLGPNAKCIGVVDDDGGSTIYWAVSSGNGSYICSYNKATATQSIILQDTRPLSTRVLNFDGISYVDMSVINDQENGKTFLIITDGVSEPKYFNIDNNLVDSAFDLEDISLIKSPPLNAPSISLIETSNSENNIKDKFYSFAYRYIYEDNEISALSPFSEFAFLPGEFRYDYNSGNNKSMFNDKNKARLSINTGSIRVKKIEIIGKESDTNAYYILEKIDKEDKSLSDNATYQFDFTNNKIFKALDISQTLRVYDNVPVNAKAVEVIGNRVVFGNYTEGYNMVNGTDRIYPKLSTSLTSSSGTSGQPHTSVKSNMDYEVGISYLDGKGRMTTPFTSEGNNIHVPISNSDKKNSLSVSISSKAPDWATNYRFFVKQSRNDYDVISPVSFYKEGIYAWIKLEGEDVNKVRKGDFLFLKSDTSGIKRSQVRVKVLDAADKERNFLDDPNDTNTKQEAGNYIKISTEEMSLNETSIDTFNYSGFAFRSDATGNDFEGNQFYVDSPVFYGSGVNDLSVTGTFSGVTDYRYEVEIISSGTPDKYKWRRINTEANLAGAWNDNSGVGYNASSSTSLGDGLTISFAASTGHIADDRWTINAKSLTRANTWDKGGTVDSYGRNAIMLFKCKTSAAESIRAGAIITLEYDDSRSDGADNVAGYVFQRFISSNNYANLEEWFWEDDVLSKMTHPETAGEIMFRRGSLVKTNGENMTINPAGDLFMCILSPANYTGSGVVRVDLDFRVLELDNPIIFETDYKNSVSEVFYEIPGTYGIDANGNHLGNTNQVYGTIDAVVNLQFFNCFGWYNGYESIKIADAFNEKKMLNDSKPLVPIDDYKQIKRVASLTYSNVYESTTSYNGLNEFNLSTANYKDIDANFGPIARMISSDGDLTVFQSNRVSRILYNKNVIMSADGNGTITQSNNVLGQDMPYQGEYGVTNNPATVTRWGGGIFFADEKRGSVLRLGANGIVPISSYGLNNWFNKNLTPNVSVVGSYDPQNDQYVIGIREGEIEWLVDTYECVQETTTSTSTTTTSTTAAVITWLEDTYECVQDVTTTTTTTESTTSAPTTTTTTTTTAATTTTIPASTIYHITGYNSSAGDACASTTGLLQVWLGGEGAIPSNGAVVYTNLNLSETFIGDGSSWIGMNINNNASPSYSVVINSSGVITSISDCSVTPTTTTTTTSTLPEVFTLSLGFSFSTGPDSCSATKATYYGNDTNLNTSTQIYSTPSGTLAIAGYYADDFGWKQWNGTAFIDSGTCEIGV